MDDAQNLFESCRKKMGVASERIHESDQRKFTQEYELG